jgi:hypothetical protein
MESHIFNKIKIHDLHIKSTELYYITGGHFELFNFPGPISVNQSSF